MPRITRQAVLDRLTGHHVVLALKKEGLGLASTSLPENEGLVQQAIQQAIDHEEQLCQKGKTSKAVGYTFQFQARSWYLDFVPVCSIAINYWLKPTLPSQAVTMTN